VAGLLLYSSIAVAALTLVISYLPGSGYLGFVPLPPSLLGLVVGIASAYALTVEVTKRYFHAHYRLRGVSRGVQLAAGRGEDIVEHFAGEAAGGGVLLAGMVGTEQPGEDAGCRRPWPKSSPRRLAMRV
jgi:hypothetical protein